MRGHVQERLSPDPVQRCRTGKTHGQDLRRRPARAILRRDYYYPSVYRDATHGRPRCLGQPTLPLTPPPPQHVIRIYLVVRQKVIEIAQFNSYNGDNG